MSRSSRVGTVRIDRFLDAMNLTLEDFANGVDNVIEDATNAAAKKAESQLRSTSPKKTGKYQQSWTHGIEFVGRGRGGKFEMVVYAQAPRYRVTHLLEHGHVVRNKYGTYGTTRGKAHIAPAQETALQEFERVFRAGLGR